MSKEKIPLTEFEQEVHKLKTTHNCVVAEEQMTQLEQENEQLRQLVRDYQKCIEDGNYSKIRVYAPKDVAKLQKRAAELLGEENK